MLSREAVLATDAEELGSVLRLLPPPGAPRSAGDPTPANRDPDVAPETPANRDPDVVPETPANRDPDVAPETPANRDPDVPEPGILRDPD